MGMTGDDMALCAFDLRNQLWSSIGSLDSSALVRATDERTFGFLSYWQVTPSEEGVSSFTDIGSEAVDFELLLNPGETAQHSLGVYDATSAAPYVLTFDRSALDADLIVTLLLDGDSVLTGTPVAEPTSPETVQTAFDLSGLDLTAYRSGATSVRVRIENQGESLVTLDNFAISGATFDTMETVGSGQIDLADVPMLVGDPSVGVSTEDFSDRPNLVQTLLDGVTFAVDDVDAASGEFLWAFQAPPFLFDFVPEGEVLSLDFSIAFSMADGSEIERIVSIAVTGRNDAPEVRDQAFTGVGADPYSVQLDAFDVDGDPLTFELATDPTQGIVTVTPEGRVDYVPGAGVFASDSFIVRVSDGNGASVERTVSLYANLINLAETGWPSVGSLDNTALVAATSDPGFEAFRLWRFEPGAGGIAPDASDPDGFELELLAGGQARHGIGVLDLDNTKSYSFALRSGTPEAELTIELLIDGNVVQTRTAVYEADDPAMAGAVFDLSTTDLSAFTIGASTVEIAITNNSADTAVRLDDFALSGAQILRIEEIGVQGFDAAALDGAVSIDSIAVAAPDAGDQEAAIVDGLSLVVHELNEANGQIAWNLTGAAGLFDFLRQGQTLDLSVTITLAEADDGTTQVVIPFTVVGNNQAPVSTAPALTTSEETAISGVLDARDIDGEDITFALVQGSLNADVSVATDGSYSYDPNVDYFGEDSFTYSVTDAFGLRIERTVVVTVSPVNDAPVNTFDRLIDQEAVLRTGQSLAISLRTLQLADPDVADPAGLDFTVNFDAGGTGSFDFGTVGTSGLTITATSLTGTLEALNTYFADGSEVIYTDTAATDSTIAISVSDNGNTGSGDPLVTSLGTVEITLDTVPVAADGVFDGQEDGQIADTLPGSDPDGDPLTFELLSDQRPENGTVTIDEDGVFVYTPYSDFVGTDSFGYRVSGGGASDTGVITLNIGATNEGGPVVFGETVRVQEDAETIGTLNAFSADGEVLSFELSPDGAPTKGTVTVDPDGRYVYSPFADENGTDFFRFIVRTASGESTGQAIITIAPVQDAPVAVPLSSATNEDVVLDGQLTASDIDGEVLTYASVEGGAPEFGSVTILETGAYTYTPNPNFFGEDRFSFSVTDGIDTVTSQVTVTVAPVNDAPEIAGDAFEVTEDGSVTRSVTVSDIDGDPLVIDLGVAPTLGAVTINPDNSYTYTPFENANGSDSFTLTVFDGTETTSADVSVTILSVNDAPTAIDDAVTLREDQSVTLSLADNDVDVDTGDLLTVTAVGLAQNGTAILQTDGTVLYTPTQDFYGVDTFTYTLSDGNGGESVGSVRLFVQSQGEIPVLGTSDDDVFRIRDAEGRDRAFDGLDGYDIVRNTRPGNDFDLTDASFDSVEEIDGNRGDIVVAQGGRLDLSRVALLTDVGAIRGQSGNETIFGSQADDRIEGAGGLDALYGDDGNDTIAGGADADLQEGGRGDDVFEITNNEGEGDSFDGGKGTDVVRNVSQRKQFFLSDAVFTGIETIDGAHGEIRVAEGGTLDLSSVANVIDVTQIRGSFGDETIIGSQVGDSIVGDRGHDLLSGGTGHDTIVGGADSDVLIGGIGDDLFEITGVEGEGDHFIGGEGYDAVVNRGNPKDFYLTGAQFDGIEEIIGGGGIIRVETDGALDLSSIALLTDVQEIEGSAGNETISGSQSDDIIDGQQGFDTVIFSGSVVDYEITILDSGQGADHYLGNGHRHDDTRAIISGPVTGTDDLLDIEDVIFDDYKLHLDGRNNAPILRPDLLTTDEDSALTVGDALLMANDYDPDGDDFAVTSVTSDEVQVTRTADGMTTFAPAGDFDSLAVGQSVTVTAHYTAEDARGAIGTGEIKLEITGVNDGPVALDDSAETAEQIIVSGNVLLNDSDIDDGAQLSVVQVNGQPITAPITLASGAVVTMGADGIFSYDPGDNFATVAVGDTATDAFSYTLTDEYNATTTATVTLTINGDNDPVTARPDAYVGQARRVFFQEVDGGILTNDSDVDIGDVLHVSAVSGGSASVSYVLREGTLVEETRIVAAGDTGGQFAVRADGSFVFDAGTDFDDLYQGQSRTTSITYTASDGNGADAQETVTVTVLASEYAPPDPSDNPPSGPPEGSKVQIVEGDFNQLGGVDVFEELAKRDSGNESIDLDTLFDLNLVDIDTTFDIDFSPTDGLSFTATDNNPGSDAILTNFADDLTTAADYVTSKINPLITAPVAPVYFGPTFDLLATIQAQFGWDISATTLGKTAVFQPAAFDLFTPDGPIEENAQFQIYTGGITNGTPTVALQTVGLGDIQIDAGYSLAELQVSDVGFVIGTQDFLGLDLDGIFTGYLGLAGDINLLDVAGDLAPVALSSTISFSATDVIDGIATIGISEFTDAVAAFASNPNKGTAKGIADVVQRAISAVGEVVATTYTIRGAELRASELITLSDRSKFNEYDSFAEDGTGVFVLTKQDGSLVEVTRADVESVIDFNNVGDIISELSNLLGKDGLTILDGLVIKATLPVGNIEEIEGFGTDAAGNTITGPQTGPQRISVEQVTRLIGAEIDFEKLGPALAERAVDQAIEKALLNPTDSTPTIIGAGLGAKVALLLGPELQGFIEEGFVTSSKIQPLALVAATFNPLIDVLNTVVRAVNVILEAVGFPPLDEIERLTEENLGETFDATIDAVADGMIAVLTGFSGVAEDVLDALANNPLTDTIDAALNIVKTVSTNGIGSALNALRDAIDTAGSALGLGSALDLLDTIFDVAAAGANAVGSFDNVLANLFSSLAASQADLSAFLADGINTFRDMIKNIAKGVDLSASAEFNLFDFTIDLGLDLVQIATFDPDAVTVTYNVGGFEAETGLGQAASFTAAATPGETLDGNVTYEFGGEVDYEYILRLDLIPELTMYGFTVDGSLTLGDEQVGEVYPYEFDYAGVKISDDLTLDEIGSLELADLFDEALIELPFGLIEEVADVLAQQVRAGLGDFAASSADLPGNEFRLFDINGIDIPKEQFTTITDTFSVAIGGVAPVSIGDIVFSEDAAGDLSDINLLDLVPGTLSQLAGSAVNLDTYVALETGGQLFVNRAGQIVFDASGDFEPLALGQSIATDIEFSTDDPDGTQQVYIVSIVVEGENDAPVAVADTAVMIEDGSVVFDPVLNDTDVDAGAVLRLVGASSENGLAEVTADGQLRFTPDIDFFGDAVISYTVSDEHDATGTGVATVSVAGTPDPVQARADIFMAPENGLSLIDVTANDYEPDGDVVNVIGFGQPSFGSLTLNAEGVLVFDPEGAFEALALGATATETVLVTVADPQGVSTAPLTITVVGANDGPVAMDDLVMAREDRAIILDLAGNDLDVDVGDVLKVVTAGPASHGQIEVLEDGTVRYTPEPEYFGPDSFAYTVSDGNGGEDNAIVDLIVRPQGEIQVSGTDGADVFEVARDDGMDRAFDGGAGYDILRNTLHGRDFDLTDASLDGIEEIDGNGGDITVGFGGQLDLSLVETLTDVGEIRGSFGDETITGSQGDDRIDGGRGADDLSGGMGNDTIVGGAHIDRLDGGAGNDVFEVDGYEAEHDTIIGGTGYDILFGTGLGSGNGQDFYLTGTVLDGIEGIHGEWGAIRVDVDGTLDLSSVETLIDVAAIRGSSGEETIKGSLGDDLIDGEQGFDTVIMPGSVLDYTITIMASGQGTAHFLGNGHSHDDSFVIVSSALTGEDRLLDIEEIVFDDYRLYLDGRNNAPIVRPDILATDEDTPLVITDAVLLANDYDPDGDDITVTSVSIGAAIQSQVEAAQLTNLPPVQPPVQTTAETTAETTAAKVNPGKGRFGAENWQGEVRSETGSIGLDMDSPMVASIDAPAAVYEAAALTIAAPDTDLIEVDRSDEGVITFTPTDEADRLAVGQSAFVTAQYTVVDPFGASSTGEITLEITGVNDRPDAVNDAAETSEQTAVSGNVLLNDSDVDAGATLRVIQVNGLLVFGAITLPSGAVVTMTTAGDFTYDPGDNFADVAVGETATDSFSYTVSDEYEATSTATVTLTINGDNDPVSDADESYAVEATGVLSVASDLGLLANASDIDLSDTPQVGGVDGITPITGSQGGVFLINPDGSFTLDTGTGFNGLDKGETLTTSVNYDVIDGNGSTVSSTVSVVVTGSRYDPFTEDEDRFDDEFDPDDFAALRPIDVSGTFEQLGGVDVATELFSDLLGTDVDLETILDITFFDVDKTINFTSLPGQNHEFSITDNGPQKAVIEGFNEAIDETFAEFERIASDFLPLDLGPVEAKPTFDMNIELDFSFGLDIDLLTLGKTAFFQPIELTLWAPEQVQANDAFILHSGDLVSLDPTSVTETIGLGSFGIESGFSIGDSTIKDLGYEIQSSNFADFELEGLASQSLTFNAELRLGDIVEQTKSFVLAIVQDVQGVFNQALPFDPQEIFDTIMSLDVEKITSNILSGQVVFDDLVEQIRSSDAATALGAVKDLVGRLTAETPEQPFARIDVDGLDGGATASELYDLFRRSLFNEYDRFDEDNTGLFTLPVIDENAELTGATVEVTAAQVIDTMDLLGIPDRINDAVEALGSYSFSPYDGIEVSFALPVDNLEIIEGFGTFDGTGAAISGPQDGVQKISVTQETALVSTSIDFEKVALSLINALLDEAADDSPQAKSLQTYVNVATQLAAAAEHGIIAELELDPAKLVLTAVNGVVTSLNTAGNAIDSIIPFDGDFFDDIPEISRGATLETIDGFIDATVGAFSGAFEVIETLVDGVADILAAFLSGGALALDVIADVLGVATNLVGGGIQGAINTLQSVADFGITIPLPLVPDIEIKPFEGIVAAPIALLRGLQTAVTAADDGVKALDSFAADIQAASDALRDFSVASAISGSLGDFGDFLKDLARGAFLGAELQANILEASLDANISIVQTATFDPNDVTVSYAVSGFEIGTELDKAVGLYALGESGDTVTGTATYNFSGEVDYDYSLKLDLDPNFAFLETKVLGTLMLGQNVNEGFEEEFTLISVTDQKPGEHSPTEDEDDNGTVLLDLQFDFTSAVTQAVEDAFADSIGQAIPADHDLGDGEVFLFRVEDVLLDEDRFLPITQEFSLDLL
jgi:VCBS repeat-containing protein